MCGVPCPRESSTKFGSNPQTRQPIASTIIPKINVGRHVVPRFTGHLLPPVRPPLKESDGDIVAKAMRWLLGAQHSGDMYRWIIKEMVSHPIVDHARRSRRGGRSVCTSDSVFAHPEPGPGLHGNRSSRNHNRNKVMPLMHAPTTRWRRRHQRCRIIRGR